MPIDNQIEPPQSFMALYVKPGQTRPNAPQEVVLARYEQCEDMASVLTEHAKTLAFKDNFSESGFQAQTGGICPVTKIALLKQLGM